MHLAHLVRKIYSDLITQIHAMTQVEREVAGHITAAAWQLHRAKFINLQSNFTTQARQYQIDTLINK